jgi:hypothetical protein
VDQVQWKSFWDNNQRYHTICLACIMKRKESKAKASLQGGAGIFDPSIFEDDEQEEYPDWGPVFLSAASKAMLLDWYRKAQKLRAGKKQRKDRKKTSDGDRQRRPRTIQDISDDEGDDAPMFSWLKEGMKDITPASKAIAIKWMRTARARLQQKRGKGVGLRERDPSEENQLNEGFRSGAKSKMAHK